MKDEQAARKIIEPRVLKGFRDFLPAQEIQKKAIEELLSHHFSSYGFVPIDTPVLEYTDVLLGKGGGETDKQIFHFHDNGNREVALRFDLTVPFARYLALHKNELAFPFKRFHIAKVWRGENPQKGRYREFTQCDFDIVGLDSAEADFEILSMMDSSFAAIGIGGYRFSVAHRGLFNAFLANRNIADKATDILRIVDKLRKIGPDAVRTQLEQTTGSLDHADAILAYITKEDPGESFDATLSRLSHLAGDETEHTTRMRTIYEYLCDAGIEDHFVFDPSITRGLDYYTGIVYETFLSDLPDFGSVCSGGRYDDLASLYTKDRLPGVGSSIGLDRLLAALGELETNSLSNGSSADIVVFRLDSGLHGWYDGLARAIRSSGLRCDVFLQDRKMGQQFKYAEANHIPFALLCGKEEQERACVRLKDLRTRKTYEDISLEKAIGIVKGNM